MKNILTIFLKEMKRVFTDKRMLLALLLPGIIIFVFYSILGDFMKDTVLANKTKDTVFEVVYTNNYSDDTSTKPRLLTYLDMTMENGNSIHSISINSSQVDEYKEKLINRDIHLLIVYSDNFENKISNYDAKMENSICLLYNGETSASSDIYTFAQAAVQVAYVNYLENIVDGKLITPNVGKKDSTLMQVMAFIFPLLTISMLFSEVITVCPEAIAGEKERGTLALMLLTPIRRSEFALGKIAALSILSIVSGIISSLGIVLSVPKLMGGGAFSLAPIEFVLLFVLIIVTLLLFVALGIAISAISNTIKEANSYLSPLMMMFMAIGILPAALGNQLWFSFIPVLNLSSSMHALLIGSNHLLMTFLITIGVNLLLTVGLMFIIAHLFKKERVILGQ